MKKILLILIVLFYSISFSQDFKAKSVELFSDLTTAPSVKRLLKIDRTFGYGGGVKVNFSLDEIYIFSLSLGYNEFTINQNEYALFSEWNWKAWKRYFGDINDPNFATATQWVQSVLKDSNYSAKFLPVQKMDVFPVVLNVGFEVSPINNLILVPSFGIGVIFYSKRLYVEETWYKKFAQLENYLYEYSYRNMAENINGNVLTANTRMDISYKLLEIVSLNLSVGYNYIFDTGDENYYHFPSKDLINYKFGITLIY